MTTYRTSREFDYSGTMPILVLSVTMVQVMAMIMIIVMMMTSVTAAPKRDKAGTNRKSTIETVPLHLDQALLHISGNLRPLANASISPWAYK